MRWIPLTILIAASSAIPALAHDSARPLLATLSTAVAMAQDMSPSDVVRAELDAARLEQRTVGVRLANGKTANGVPIEVNDRRCVLQNLSGRPQRFSLRDIRAVFDVQTGQVLAAVSAPPPHKSDKMGQIVTTLGFVALIFVWIVYSLPHT